MRNKRIARISLNAMFLAIILLMSFVPQLGYIQIGPLPALTLIHIIVLLGAYLLPFYGGVFLGTAFGLTSWIVALTVGAANPANIPFQNPVISVLPRVLFGLLASITFYFIRKHFYHHKKALPFIIGTAAFLLTMIHSVVVLLLLVAFRTMAWQAFAAVISFNSILEAALAAVVVPLVAMSLYKVVPKYNQIPEKKLKKPPINGANTIIKE